ncbi:unnamed protein product [Moneuplotes crassus]|uniref:Uncharacterized protein n=1 Tax=Euplotes crassus TaxID=5936 RepID=A0AAD1Y5S9_EUPCR|nr:unnamed protein product [Moneuplotes crassus]
MNIYKQLDENLSDDLLDENVSASPIKTSPKLVKNMSSTPFESKVGPGSFIKGSSFTARRVDEYARSCKNISEIKTIGLHSQISCKDDFCGKRNLQDEIKGLLQRAIQIRNSSESSSDKLVSSEGLEVEPNNSSSCSNKIVTMEDVFAP